MSTTPMGYAPGGGAAEKSVAPPQPNRLHWGFVLLFDACTYWAFDLFWIVLQARWVRKVTGRSRALTWALVSALVPLVLFIGGLVGSLLHDGSSSGESSNNVLAKVGVALLGAALLGMRLMALYTLRTELAAAPINMPTSPVMTLLFGAIYFQYHLQDYRLANDSVAMEGTGEPRKKYSV